MAQSTKLIFVVLTIFLGIVPMAAPAFYEAPLSNEATKLLNNRWAVKLPPTTRVEELGKDQRFKDFSPARSRVIFEKGDQQLVLEVRELFAFRADDFTGRIADIMKRYANPVGMKYTISQIDRDRFLVKPSQFIGKNGLLLNRVLFFVNFDFTVLSVDVYGNEAALKDPVKFEALVMRILSTSEKGTRKFDMSDRTVNLVSKSGDYAIKFKVPKRYIVSVDENDRGVNYSVRRLIPLASRNVKLDVALGKQSPDQSVGHGITEASRLANYALGRKVSWEDKSSNVRGKGLSVSASASTQEYAYYDRQSQTYITLNVEAESDSSLKALIALASGLTLMRAPEIRYAHWDLNTNTVATAGDRPVENPVRPEETQVGPTEQGVDRRDARSNTRYDPEDEVAVSRVEQDSDVTYSRQVSPEQSNDAPRRPTYSYQHQDEYSSNHGDTYWEQRRRDRGETRRDTYWDSYRSQNQHYRSGTERTYPRRTRETYRHQDESEQTYRHDSTDYHSNDERPRRRYYYYREYNY